MQTRPDIMQSSAMHRFLGIFELVELVCEHLLIEDLYRLQQVCHTFNDVITKSKSSIIQQRLFLKAAPAGQPWLISPTVIYASTASFMGSKGKADRLRGDKLQKVMPYEYSPTLLRMYPLTVPRSYFEDTYWQGALLARVSLRAKHPNGDGRFLYVQDKFYKNLTVLPAKARSMFLSQPPVTRVRFDIWSDYSLPFLRMCSVTNEDGITFGEFADAVHAELSQTPELYDAYLSGLRFLDGPGVCQVHRKILEVSREEVQLVEKS